MAVAAAWVDYLAGAHFPAAYHGGDDYPCVAAAVGFRAAGYRHPGGSAVYPAVCPASVDSFWIYWISED
jgi:hypothetical protein